jgi:hypothetical protein
MRIRQDKYTNFVVISYNSVKLKINIKSSGKYNNRKSGLKLFELTNWH